VSIETWSQIRSRFVFQRRDIRGADAPLASATKDGVFLRDDLDISVWNPESDVSNYKLVEPDDFVIGLRSFQHGISHSEIRGIVSPAYTVLRRTGAVDPRYFKYYFRSALLISQLANITQGIRQGQTIDMEAFGNLDLPVPPLGEQRRIADFLDAETARMDHLAGGQLKIIDLLEERANAQILEIIGKSRLVASEGTPTIPIRRLITKLSRPVLQTDEVITAFRDGQVTARGLRRNEGYTLSADAEPQGQGVKVGDIIVHGLDGFAGAIGDSEAAGNCTPVYHVCTPIDGGNSAFYGRLLRLLALNGYLALYGGSARERAVDFRNWKMFGNAGIPHVEAVVQHEIGNMITKIRPLRAEVKRFNERLGERRQALITAAVTGGIAV
jgi:type I restriction enzyme, S subunit